MENKIFVFTLLILLLGFLGIIYLYNNLINDLAAKSCTDVLGEKCPHAKVSEIQTYIIFFLLFLLILLIFWIGKIYLEKSKKQEITDFIKKDVKKIDFSKLDDDEKKVFSIINENNGSVFQSELVKKTSYTKVKISRILDRLEQKGLIERKRRGMTNLVVIK
jgi:uncharacterized membrane protein